MAQVRLRAQRRAHHYIYRTTCEVTGRYYIGMHSTDDLDDGYVGSGKRLRYSINKHGPETHSKEILEFCESREELKRREAEIVNEELVGDEMCMNLKLGGHGGWDHIDQSLEERQKNGKLGGKRHSDRIQNDQAYREIVAKAALKELKRRWSNGWDWHPTFAGLSHTKETKAKIGATNAIKQSGVNNSQYGTFWITDGKTNKKSRSNEEIPHGWRRGRTCFCSSMVVASD